MLAISVTRNALLFLGILSVSATGDTNTGCGNLRTLYQFPNGSWLENIAVRPNGKLLLTRIDVPVIHQLDPFAHNPTPELLVSLPDATSIFGIAEISPDTFAFSTGNFSFDGSLVAAVRDVRKFDLNHDTTRCPSVSKIADIPAAGLLNGMTVLPATQTPHEILSGDIMSGIIYRISPSTGAVSVAVNNSLTAVGDLLGSGVNGIRVSPSRPDVLYLANTGQHVLASIAINPLTGISTGKDHVIANITAPPGTFNFDDFALPHNLEEDDAAYIVTSSGNSVERIPLNGPMQGQRRLVAGDLNSTLIAEPTSAAFGRTMADSDVLYVVTGGGALAPINGDTIVGAQVLAIEVGGCRKGRGHWGEK